MHAALSRTSIKPSLFITLLAVASVPQAPERGLDSCRTRRGSQDRPPWVDTPRDALGL